MTVYVVQQQQRRDDRTGEWKVVHDLTPARAFGELSVLLGPRVQPFWNAQDVIDELNDKLVSYDPENDWIVPMGNPALIGWAIAIAAQRGGGRVRTLIWSQRQRAYIPTDATLVPHWLTEAQRGT